MDVARQHEANAKHTATYEACICLATLESAAASAMVASDAPECLPVRFLMGKCDQIAHVSQSDRFAPQIGNPSCFVTKRWVQARSAMSVQEAFAAPTNSWQLRQ